MIFDYITLNKKNLKKQKFVKNGCILYTIKNLHKLVNTFKFYCLVINLKKN